MHKKCTSDSRAFFSGIIGFLAGVVAAIIYAWKVLPWMNNFGSTEEERRMPVPADDEVSDDILLQQNTRAFTIDAPPERVYPWLSQMGRDGTGWYSYDWLDNRGRPSADYIREDVPPAQVGDRADDFTITQVAPNEYVCYAVHDHQDPMTLGCVVDGSFTWWLRLLADGRTRVIHRFRLGGRGALVWWTLRLNEVIEFIMAQKAFRRIKWLVETYPARYPELADRPWPPEK